MLARLRVGTSPVAPASLVDDAMEEGVCVSPPAKPEMPDAHPYSACISIAACKRQLLTNDSQHYFEMRIRQRQAAVAAIAEEVDARKASRFHDQCEGDFPTRASASEPEPELAASATCEDEVGVHEDNDTPPPHSRDASVQCSQPWCGTVSCWPSGPRLETGRECACAEVGSPCTELGGAVSSKSTHAALPWASHSIRRQPVRRPVSRADAWTAVDVFASELRLDRAYSGWRTASPMTSPFLTEAADVRAPCPPSPRRAW